MLHIQFALELETLISNQLVKLSKTGANETMAVIELIRQSQTEFTQLLTLVKTIDIDSVPYPGVSENQLLGSDTAWQQVTRSVAAAGISFEGLGVYWSLYTAIDKAAQFYQQAAVNSAHPQSRLFFSSLSQVKKILRRRLDGIIHIYYNHFWGELGFAPFILGKD
jgi:hypothetical protein